MTEKDRQIELKVGDRVIELSSNNKGTITRLCSDKNTVYVVWDTSKIPEMVEVSKLGKE
ncbi:hypothetical protein ES708_08024 [subsurface metagenome]